MTEFLKNLFYFAVEFLIILLAVLLIIGLGIASPTIFFTILIGGAVLVLCWYSERGN